MARSRQSKRPFKGWLIGRTLLRWLLSLLDPNFKAELAAFEQIKAAKQREREAIQEDITEIERQIAAAQERQNISQNRFELHLAQVEQLEASIQKVKNENQVDASHVDDASALRDKL